MSWFSSYLDCELQKRGIDSSVFSPFILNILEGSNVDDSLSLFDIFKEIDTKEDSIEFIEEIEKIYKYWIINPDECREYYSRNAFISQFNDLVGEDSLQNGINNNTDINNSTSSNNYFLNDSFNNQFTNNSSYCDNNDLPLLSNLNGTDHNILSNDFSSDYNSTFNHDDMDYNSENNLMQYDYNFDNNNNNEDYLTVDNNLEFDVSTLDLNTDDYNNESEDINVIEDTSDVEIQQSYYALVEWMNQIEQVDIIIKSNYDMSPNGEQVFSPDSIACALFYSNGDINNAINLLFEAKSVTDSCKPCRHMLTSKCMRKDCYYDHELSSIPCRFWLYNSCLKHQEFQLNEEDINNNLISCPFLHALSPITTTKSFITTEISTDISEFPSLSDAKNSTSNNNNSNKSSTPLASSKQKHKENNKLDSNTYHSYRINTNKSYADALLTKPKVNQVIQNDYVDYSTDFVFNSYDIDNNYDYNNYFSSFLNDNKEVLTTKYQNYYDNNNNNTSKSVKGIDWVESGIAVSKDYQLLRSEARELAISRNKLLEEATKSFLMGSKSAARTLSVEGQRLNALMKEKHIEAALEIFRKRNTPSSILKGKIDLHGLHIIEAQECLYAFLPILINSGVKPINIITGTGHHTLGPQKGKSRLLPIVKEIVTVEFGLKMKAVNDVNGFIGAVQVFY